MADGAGNAEQVRTVAEQLFQVWKAEQARESKETRRWFGGNVGSWLTALAVVIGVIIGLVNTHNIALAANDRSIRTEHSLTVTKADNGDRLARIETKIDLMMEERKK